MSAPTSRQISGGLLAVSYSPDPKHADLFKEWYVRERVPALMAVPGFKGATTYICTEVWVRQEGKGLVPVTPPPEFLTLYTLTNVDVLKSNAYQDATNRTFTETYPSVDGKQIEVRKNYSLPASGITRMDNPPQELDPNRKRGLLFVSMSPEPEYEDKHYEWYETIHLPEMLACPGFIGTHRYRAVEGLANIIAVYDLESPDTLKTPEFRAVSGRPVDQLQPLAQEVSAHRRGNISATFEEVAHTGEWGPQN